MGEPIRPISQATVTDTVGLTTGSPEQQADALSSLRTEGPPVESDGVDVISVVSERDRGFSSISNFISQNQVTGFAKAHRFLVTFNFGGALLGAANPLAGLTTQDLSTLLTFKCEQAEFPGREFITSDARIYGPTYKSPYQSTYQDVTLTLICDSAMTQRHIFEVWMSYINSPSSFDFNYRDDYVCDVDIEQFNELNDRTYISKLKEAYPVSVTPIQASWSDDSVHKLQVTLTYRYFQSRIGKTNTQLDYEELRQAHDARVTDAALFTTDRSFFKEDNREHRRKIALASEESRNNFRSVIDSLELEGG